MVRALRLGVSFTLVLALGLLEAAYASPVMQNGEHRVARARLGDHYRQGLVVAKAAPPAEEKGFGGFLNKMKAAGIKNRMVLEQYMKDKNIDIREIPKAIIIYEFTSAGLMFGVWAVCYLAQPTQRGLIMAKLAKPGQFEAAMAKGQKIASQKAKGQGASVIKRLATSYAEGAVLRTAIKPLIIPAKLFVTWKLQQVFNLVTGKHTNEVGTGKTPSSKAVASNNKAKGGKK